MAKTNVSTSQSFAAAAKRIREASGKISAVVHGGLRGIAEEIMTDVKASGPGHGVPVKTGALRSTGEVTQPADNVVELSFGGAAAPYALVQHESVELHHVIGEARYLVRGLERWKPDGSAAMTTLRRNAKAALEKAGK